MGTVVDGLIRPSGIAVVGATNERYYARSLIRNLLSAGYDRDRIFPVHPRQEPVAGLRCYPKLAAINQPVSLVAIATRAETVADLVGEAGEIGATAALVLADGFAEQGPMGRDMQQEVSAAAERAGVAILGPNTLGFVAPPEGVGAWAAGELPQPLDPGTIGLAFQSSGMLNLVLSLALQRRLGVRAAFSTGNEVTVDSADVIEFLARDDLARVIAVLLETTTRPRRLVAALDLARRRKKPVVMLKLGSSRRAQQNALAHTGRLTTSGKAWDAMLERLGVVLVEDLDELVEAAALFDQYGTVRHRPGECRASQAAFATISGGDCSLLADLSDRVSLPLAEISSATVSRLAEIMEKPDLVGNPLDCENLHQTRPQQFIEAVRTLCRDSAVDIIGFRLNLPREPNNKLQTLYQEVTHTAKECDSLPVILSRANEDIGEKWYDFFAGLKVPFLPSYRPALSVLARWCSGRRERNEDGHRISIDAVPEQMMQPVSGRVASWSETQDLLKRAKVAYAPSRLVTSTEEALRTSEELGFPLVAKIIAPDAPHKSDIGGVVAGLENGRQVEDAFSRLWETAHMRDLDLEGIELQAMVSGGLEMILGAKVDPVVGPLLLVGMGGVLAEVTNDVAVTVPNVDEHLAEHLVRSLAGAQLLDGYRGHEPVDVGALARLVASFSQFVVDARGQLVELDLNPILILPEDKGVVAVDALAVLR